MAGVPRIVTSVSRKPSAVCRVSAVPLTSSRVTSVTITENWAESATTEVPHRSTIGTTTNGLRPKNHGEAIAIDPETARAVAAATSRPNRSDTIPAIQEPTPPAAITKNVSVDTLPNESPATAWEAKRKAAAQVHSAYNSHMWPR